MRQQAGMQARGLHLELAMLACSLPQQLRNRIECIAIQLWRLFQRRYSQWL